MSAWDDIAAEVFGTRLPLVVEREPEGVSTEVYRIARGAEQFFLRLAEDEGDNLEVDALVHERLASLGVKTPAVVHVTPHEPRVGRSLMITRHIGGDPLTTASASAVRRSVIERAAEDVAVINSVLVSGFGWVVRDRPTWPPRAECENYALYVMDDLPNPWPGRFSELFSRPDLDLIEQLVSTERERVIDQAILVHGDLGLDHIFHSGGDYTGIIDFGELRGAEPEFDLAVFFNHSPREDRAALIDAMLRGYQQVSPLPGDIRHRMRLAGMFKALRQLGRWLQPDFPHERDAAALAALISRRFLRGVEASRAAARRATGPGATEKKAPEADPGSSSLRDRRRDVAPDGSPVALYLKLDGTDEAAFIHRLLPEASSLLELGAGAGRITRHLTAAGHSITAVDNSQAMLDQLDEVDGVETVLADIRNLDLLPRQWPVVLLSSHLINDAGGPAFLASAARHTEPNGVVLIQRHEPGWIDRVEPYISRRPGLEISLAEVSRPSSGVLDATMVFDIDGDRYEQKFTAYEVDDDRIVALAASVGCEVIDVLGEHRKWIRLRRRAMKASR